MLLKGDQRLLAINDIFGYNREGLRGPGVEAYIGTDWAYRRAVPEPEPRSYGRPAPGKGRIGLLLDQSGVHKDRSNQVPPDGKARLDAPFGHEISTQRTRVKVPVLERREVGIAQGDVGP